jgi:alpha-beta hydrolase superfamily lysophospholipase
VGIVIGFIPWIVYWILVGNIPFTTAVTVAFAVTLLIQIALRIRKQPMRTLDVGNLIVFALLMIAAYVVPDDVLERWLQPLSSLGLLLIALVGVLIGKPFVREYAESSVDAATAKTQGFRTITTAMTWMWVGAFAVMFASAMISPIVDGNATILDMDDTLSIVCYWVVPFTVLGLAGAVSAAFPPWFDKKSAEVDHRGSQEAPVVAHQPPPAADLDGLTITAPADSRFDEPFAVTVAGSRPGSQLQVTTTGTDLFGRTWRSTAAFTVPSDGVLDVASAAPQRLDGQDPDWTGTDGTAPIWAMRFDDPGSTPEMFVPPAEPWQLTIDATEVGAVAGSGSGRADAGRPAAGRRTVLRRTGAADLHYEPAKVGDLPGMLLLPGGRRPDAGWPAVACFGGSEGGFESQLSNAAVLASHGFAVLAQAWISEADAGESVSEVPLERFATALTTLAQHDGVDGTRLGAMAISRGSEGLLAAVAHGLTPTLTGLVLVSPSAVTWQALGGGGEVPDTSSWTVGGSPLPWMPLSSGVLMRQIVHNAWTVGRDISRKRPTLLRLRAAYETSLIQAGLLDKHGRPADPAGGNGAGAHPAVIDTVAVRAPLLLITGKADALWPGEPMARMIAAQRRAAGVDHQDRLEIYDGAGHLIRLGVLPTDAAWTNGIAFGGTREGLAQAQAGATARVAAFLGAGVVTPA